MNESQPEKSFPAISEEVDSVNNPSDCKQDFDGLDMQSMSQQEEIKTMNQVDPNTQEPGVDADDDFFEPMSEDELYIPEPDPEMEDIYDVPGEDDDDKPEQEEKSYQDYEETGEQTSNQSPRVVQSEQVEASKGEIRYPSGFRWDGLGNTRFKRRLYRGRKVTVTISGETVSTREPSESSDQVNEYEFGEKVDVLGYTLGQQIRGENKWWVTEDHSYIWTGITDENPV